jgi:alanyl-tRNA synthetase
MSLTEEKHEWGAVRVRQTFIDYFKERGHEFGMSNIILQPEHPRFLL